MIGVMIESRQLTLLTLIVTLLISTNPADFIHLTLSLSLSSAQLPAVFHLLGVSAQLSSHTHKVSQPPTQNYHEADNITINAMKDQKEYDMNTFVKKASLYKQIYSSSLNTFIFFLSPDINLSNLALREAELLEIYRLVSGK